MSQPDVSLYVVVEEATGIEDERAFVDVVNRHLNQMSSNAIDEVGLEVHPTGKGLVEVCFVTNQWRLASAAKRAASANLRSLGLQVLEEIPGEHPTAPPHPAEKRVQLAPPQIFKQAPPAVRPTHQSEMLPAPVEKLPFEAKPQEGVAVTSASPADMLLADDVLAIMAAEDGAVRPHAIAAELQQSIEVIERLLERLAGAGFVNGSAATLFTLTEAGVVEAQGIIFRGGRKAVVEALLEGGELTSYSLAEVLQVSVGMVKKSLYLLLDEEIVERGGLERAAQAGGRRRRKFRLTAKAQAIGHSYVPPSDRKKSGWDKLGDARISVVLTLFAAYELLTPTQLNRTTGMSVSAVKEFLRLSVTEGYMYREQVSMAPPTYGYGLTDTGREAALVYATVPEVADASDVSGVVAADPEAIITATLEAMTRRYVVTVQGSVPGLADLLAKLDALAGVTVEPTDAQ